MVRPYILTDLAMTEKLKTTGLRAATFILIALLSLLAAGCSEDKGPSLKQVPANADYVAFIDADSAGIAKFLPDYAAEMLKSIEKSVSLKEIMVYKPAETRQAIVAIAVTDADGLTKSLTDSGMLSTKLSGETVYVPVDGNDFSPCMAIADGSLWCFGSKADVANWQKSLKQAEKENFEKYGLDKFVAERKQLLAFVNPASLGFGGEESMIKIEAAITGNSLQASARIISVAEGSVGENIPLKGPEPMTDMTFLRYMPEGNGLIVAGGLTGAINWSGIADMLGQGLDTRNQGMLQTLLPYMGSLRGSTAIGLGPFTSQNIRSEELESQSIIIYAPMEGSKAAEAVNEINTNLKAKGLTPAPRADGIYAYTLGENRYRYTARDGVFMFALNRELDGAARPDSTLYAGRQVAAQLTLPPLSALIPGSKKSTAINATFTLTSDGAELKLTAPGSANPLEALSDYLEALVNYGEQTETESDDYYDTYD